MPMLMSVHFPTHTRRRIYVCMWPLPSRNQAWLCSFRQALGPRLESMLCSLVTAHFELTAQMPRPNLSPGGVGSREDLWIVHCTNDESGQC